MKIGAKSVERNSIVSVAEALQLMLGFGSLLISVLTLVVAILKHKDTKK